MYSLNENYYHRKCYFKREQVPTQTVMIDRMKRPLAMVYFKSMIMKLKVLAGLEPPMVGGGSDWYMPPDDLLQGRAVLKPVQKEHLSKLGFNAIDFFGEMLVRNHKRRLYLEKVAALEESDLYWKKSIDAACRQQYEDTSREEAKENTAKIQAAFLEFEVLYTTFVTKTENTLFEAAVKDIKRVRQAAYDYMKKRYETMVKKQATMLYDEYTEKLNKEKARLKVKFIREVEVSKTDLGHRIHDLNFEKHLAIEKLRHLLECQNLACRVYVALKEREECKKEMDLSKHIHAKKVRAMKEEIAMKDFEIRLEKEQEIKRQEFIKIWKKKICHVVKKFQIFVEYCLKVLPQHAEFFLNMEKLMLLQLNEVIENPSAPSIIESEKEGFHTPIPRPHPFYLFCDKGYKPNLDQNLCPKHCTSSASQFPVIVVNKQCIYAACDNFDIYTNKITQYLGGQRGDDIDVEDDHDYKYDVPVKYTSELHLQELQLESSLMQVLQQELPNVKQVPVECCVCKIPYCFCSPLHTSKMSLFKSKKAAKKGSTPPVPSLGNLIQKTEELQLEREPKWESYLDYVMPKKCKCAKTAKKHLQEHMPAYMRNMSPFDAPELPHYEPCPLPVLKKLVKKARGVVTPPPTPPRVESKTRDISTEYVDQDFEFLCTCFSDEELKKLFEMLAKAQGPDAKKSDLKLVSGSKMPSFMARTASSFATDRAFSLRNLLDDHPQLEEIFKSENCHFD